MPVISDRLYRKASIQKIPLNGGFELSPVCNFSCRMCYVRKTPAQIAAEGQRLRDWKEWLHLAEQCYDAGTLYLLLTGGEPFVYPHFRELYTELHRMGFVLSINSNGTMIDRETIGWLKKVSPSRMNITLYGASRETYGRICGHPEGYERAVSAIKMLKEEGIPVVINGSMIPENADDLEEIIRFGKDLGINTRIATYMFPPVRRVHEEKDSRFSPEQAAEMNLRRLKCQMEKEDFYKMLQSEAELLEIRRAEKESWGTDQEYMRCRAGRSSFWVSWDGIMTACGILPFPVRKYPFEQDFKESWLELTDQVRNTPVLRECAGCAKKRICKPCVAMLYSETGDVNKRAPYMCKMADSLYKRMINDWKEGQGNE